MRPSVLCRNFVLAAAMVLASAPSTVAAASGDAEVDAALDATFDATFAIRLVERLALDGAESRAVSEGRGPHDPGMVAGYDWAEVGIANAAKACPETVRRSRDNVRFRVLVGTGDVTREFLTDAMGTVIKVEDVIAEPRARIATPSSHSIVRSPFTVRGEVTLWMFEAEFPVRLYTPDGVAIAQGHGTATAAWMTETAVPFEAELAFDPPALDTPAFLTLERANPSGLAVFAAYYLVPVRVAGAAP